MIELLLIVDDKNDVKASSADLVDWDWSAHSLIAKQQNRFAVYANAGNFEYLSRLFSEIMDMIARSRMSLKSVHNITIDLFSVISHLLKEMDTGIYTVTNGHFSYDTILNMKSLQEIHTWGQTIISDLVSFFESYRLNSASIVIKKAKEYILEQYSDDISLEQVAEHIFLNPVYFGRLFKKQTGCTFTDYLIQVRMKKAMELLQKPQYKVYEIAPLIGYKNTKYFIKIFKLFVGCTPTQYREKLR
ncbi:helix-turn-helix transcriptional regulator [Paenibacillus eucommiae]|uniref:YesN/AraC family two-component response regulator n=1 Tax=Paenibacillus eucommiae TaxID=1355755 RepID=A0ABS4IM15_9BACL|nr:helix-turn-helix domain-containing protein [Paenibacillus eucommiae]MBP1988611.1 YesN/AraC family two-component response regulator [Paenibacillus eucommiae]